VLTYTKRPKKQKSSGIFQNFEIGVDLCSVGGEAAWQHCNKYPQIWTQMAIIVFQNSEQGSHIVLTGFRALQ
jgi:hypothetical protein